MLHLGLLSAICVVYFLILTTLDSNVAVPIRQSGKSRTKLKSKVNMLQKLYAEHQDQGMKEDGGANLYYPNKEQLETVCMDRSTIYNFPRVVDYLRHEIILYLDDFMKRRDLYMDLRLELYKSARSEECHVENMTKWRDYLECAIMRNQRMEYMIPKYPLHQVHYHFETDKWSEPWQK